MTTSTTQAERAQRFRALHDDAELLLLPNAWDPITARIFAAAGFPAIATTSAGVAEALGSNDGEHTPLDLIVAATGRIVAAVDLPVTADIEAGFGATAHDVGETVRRIIGAGAIGINLEDVIYPDERLFELSEAARRVTAARSAAEAEGVPLYINARTDVFLLRVGEPGDRLAESLRRAAAFIDAGASGIFVPMVADNATIGALAAQIAAPLNVLARPGLPPRAELRRLGVRRVSLGSSAMRATMAYLRALAADVRDAAGFGFLDRPATPYPSIPSGAS